MGQAQVGSGGKASWACYVGYRKEVAMGRSHLGLAGSNEGVWGRGKCARSWTGREAGHEQASSAVCTTGSRAAAALLLAGDEGREAKTTGLDGGGRMQVKELQAEKVPWGGGVLVRPCVAPARLGRSGARGTARGRKAGRGSKARQQAMQGSRLGRWSLGVLVLEAAGQRRRRLIHF